MTAPSAEPQTLDRVGRYASAVRLVKWQRNTIILAVEAGGLDWRDGCSFEFDDTGVRITHVASESHFRLEGDPGRYTADVVVGDGPQLQFEDFTWAKVEEHVRRWAERVKHYVDMPDLWAERQREREVLTDARYETVANTPFTPDEQAEIVEQLRQIKELVKATQSLSQGQRLSLEARLDQIEEAAGRIGRKDWRLMVYGVIFQVVVMDLLPEAAHPIVHTLVMALGALGRLFGGGPGPPELLAS
jgi:hypothetical protein